MFKNAQVVLLTTEPIKQEKITRNGHYHEGLVLYRDKETINLNLEYEIRYTL